jgi:hypothetical protein
MENLSNTTDTTREKFLQDQITGLKVDHDNLQKKLEILKLELDSMLEESNKKMTAINIFSEFLAKEQASKEEEIMEWPNGKPGCEGCLCGYLNQQGHMGYGGCLEEPEPEFE